MFLGSQFDPEESGVVVAGKQIFNRLKEADIRHAQMSKRLRIANRIHLFCALQENREDPV